MLRTRATFSWPILYIVSVVFTKDRSCYTLTKSYTGVPSVYNALLHIMSFVYTKERSCYTLNKRYAGVPSVYITQSTQNQTIEVLG